MHSLSEWLGQPINKASIEQAAYWITRMDQGEFDETAFSMWLHQSQDNSVAYYQLSEVWAKTACLNELKKYTDTASQFGAMPKNTNDVHQILQDCNSLATASSSSFYYVVIGLITFGFLIPFI